jgi:hypothetical protein
MRANSRTKTRTIIRRPQRRVRLSAIRSQHFVVRYFESKLLRFLAGGHRGQKIPTPQQDQNVPRPFCRLLWSILWLRPRLGTHFCFYLLSLGVSCAIFFFFLARFGANFLPFWKAQTTEKPRISSRGSSKSRFSLYSRRVPRWDSLGGVLGLSWGPLGHFLRLSWGLLVASREHLGDFLAASWRFPGGLLGLLGGILGLRASQGSSRGLPGPPGRLLGSSWGPPGDLLEPSWRPPAS